MKTLVVLAALAAVALAGPTSRADDADLGITKEKRSPTFGSVHQHLPIHHHQPYVQPIIPHHLGLKKPLIVSHPYGHGHHGHLFRSDDEQLETHSTEAKESKKTCMKEIEAKCDDEISAKSSESEDTAKLQDIDGSVSDSEVAQSLKMAKEAVDNLQKKLQLAEKNPKMMQWKHGESEADGNMHENVETAKLALEHMQRNFGNLESMNVHARAFKNAEVHDANLKIEPVLKSSMDLKTDEERLAQWKDAIDTIQQNVELVRNIEDSFQKNDHSEKSATLEKSSTLKHEIKDDAKEGHIALQKEESSEKGISDMKLAQNMEKMSNVDKSSWQAREHEKTFDSKNEMETSASTLSESKTTHHSTNEKVFRSESSQLEKNTDKLSIPNAKSLEMKSSIKQSSQPKSNEDSDMKQAKQAHIEIEMDSPLVDSDSTTFMKAAEHNHDEQHKKIEHFSSSGHSFIKEHGMSTHDHQKMAPDHHQAGHLSHMGHSMGSHDDQQTLSDPTMHAKEAHKISLELPKAKESTLLDQHKLSISTKGGKDAHDMPMKSSDQLAGQSQLSEMTAKHIDLVPSKLHSEKIHPSLSHGAHGKSAEDGTLFAPVGMNTNFKEALVPKAWKEAQSARGAYGSGISGLSGYGSGYGSGSGAVGVFPSAHVGGCAVPLLLSCSPNVVAGHLAKGHSYSAPSYGASGYRASDNLSSHSKRDITKISRQSTINRTPTNKGLQHKTILITDKL